MTYQVIARKWRPQVFADMVGQEHITRTLENAIKQGRIHHAYLFTGARGIGKTSAARILAKCLNCEQGPSPIPCNQCDFCLEITSSSSMDVIELDGASHTGVDDVRDIQENVQYLPSKSRYKIYIIDEVHMLSTSAFNALLKTLEEPPDHVIFVFATTEPHKIPATIISRCQRFDFKRILPRDIVTHLKKISQAEKFEVSDAGLHLISRQASGSMRDAQSILDQIISFGGDEVKDEDIVKVLGLIDRELLYNLVDSILNQDAAECLSIFDHAFNFGYDITQLIQELLTVFRNMLVVKVAPTSEHLLELSTEEIDLLKNKCREISAMYLEQLFTILSQSIDSVHRSLTPRMIMEVVLLKMIHTPAIIPIDEIIARIEDISQKINIEDARHISTTPPGDNPDAAKVKKNTDTDGAAPAAKKTIHSREASKKSLPRKKSDAPAKKLPPNPFDRWQELLHYISKKYAQLGATLGHAKLKSFNNKELHIQFEKKFHYSSIMEEKKTNKKFSELVSDFIGGSMEIIVEDISQKVKQEQKAIEGQETELHLKLKKEARENPIVLEALEIFETSIDEIRTSNIFKKGIQEESQEESAEE